MSIRCIIIVFFIITLSITLNAGSLRAESSDIKEEEKELRAIEDRLQRTKEDVRGIKEKESSVLGELEKVNRTLNKERKALKKAQYSLGSIKQDIKKTDKEILRLSKKKKMSSERLSKRLGAMYKMQRGGLLRVLNASMPVGAEAGELDRRYKYMTVIMDSDLSLMDEASKDIINLNKEREHLAGLRDSLDRTRKLALLKKEVTQKKFSLRESLLRDVRREKEAHMGLLLELEDASEALQAVIAMLKKEASQGGAAKSSASFTGKGFKGMKGRLPMPVKGNIISKYGKVKHPKFNTVTFNNGILIKAAYGAEARAVYAGKVAYVGWLKGYGQVLIMDNGEGYYTLFAHLSEVIAKKGDVVGRGDTIGLIGDSGTHETAGLYFEVREGGKTKDPMNWVLVR
jgi:septal ring factor EnvC (AmiA/AmiB activator)